MQFVLKGGSTDKGAAEGLRRVDRREDADLREDPYGEDHPSRDGLLGLVALNLPPGARPSWVGQRRHPRANIILLTPTAPFRALLLGLVALNRPPGALQV